MGGKRCCVRRCTSNGNSYLKQPHITIYSFPKDEVRKKEWIRRINRDNFTPSATSVICINHFSENFIERIRSAVTLSGEVVSLKRKNPSLTADAYPSLFENQPIYSEPPAKRRALKDRQLDIINYKETEKEVKLADQKKINSTSSSQLLPQQSRGDLDSHPQTSYSPTEFSFEKGRYVTREQVSAEVKKEPEELSQCSMHSFDSQQSNMDCSGTLDQTIVIKILETEMCIKDEPIDFIKSNGQSEISQPCGNNRSIQTDLKMNDVLLLEEQVSILKSENTALRKKLKECGIDYTFLH